MSKIILTIALVLSVGIFSLLKTNVIPANEKTAAMPVEKLSAGNGMAILATAD